MKTNVRFPFVGRLVFALLQIAPIVASAQSEQPRILSIAPARTNAVVEVAFPAGVQRVVLESRTRLTSGAWTPAAIQRTDGTRGVLRFTIPLSQRMELLRVRADYTLPLPAKFYGGTNEFWGGQTNTVAVFNDALAAGARDSAFNGREVVESDIWKRSGDRLYFFNTYRGLQIIDIKNPDQAQLLGTFPLPAAGEDMYLLDSDHVVLLAQNGCSYPSESQVLLVSVTNAAQPVAITNLPIQGYVLESRLVGTALYVASQTYRQLQGTNSTWEWGTVVSSFDLANPAKPVMRSTLWFPGYGNVVMATDILLFIGSLAPPDNYNSALEVIDITSPDGTMAAYGTVKLRGRIADKFKLHYVGGVLTTIAEDWGRTNGVNVTTWLETFRVPDPRSASPLGISKLAQLELGRGERLHATRFDADKVYVVTFFQIDPLWIVDLSDPTKPRIAGELEVPGWSTYIHPMGDRLLSVGVETNRVAVSLFDVANPAKPGLLSRALLGNNYSWSEANYDEKAFTVLEDDGLVLVPYSGDTSNGWASRVQLIDLTRSNLVQRGLIEHTFQPRRSTIHRERVLSLSGQALLSVNITNRDLPVVSGSAQLAWSVDRVFLAGDYVLQLTANTYGLDSLGEAALYVAPAEAPDRILGQLGLGGGRVAGATSRSNLLYIAQADQSLSETGKTTFTLTVVDARSAPSIQILGRRQVSIEETGWVFGNWSPVWTGDSVLVWAGGGFDWWWGPWLRPALGFTDGLWRWPWPNSDSGGGHLLAFQVSDPANPVFASELNLIPTDTWRRFSLPYASGTLLYLSHSGSELQPGTTNIWLERHYLNVVDYTDPESPAVRKPVNIPGTLQGLSHGGEMIYTKGLHWTTNITSWEEWLDAVAYDGVAAHLVASMPLGLDWPKPLALDGPNIYLGRALYESGTNAAAHTMQRWFLNVDGKFELEASLSMVNPVSAIWVKDGLLAGQQDYRNVMLFDVSHLKVLLPIGELLTPGCTTPYLSQADGALGRGIWVPLGVYGVTWAKAGQ